MPPIVYVFNCYVDHLGHMYYCCLHCHVRCRNMAAIRFHLLGCTQARRVLQHIQQHLRPPQDPMEWEDSNFNIFSYILNEDYVFH